MNEGKAETGLFRLRPYQVGAMDAVLTSVKRRLGHTITIEMARQSGKNEMSAQVEIELLGRAIGSGLDIIKCAPTFRPQLRMSMLRLWGYLQRSGLGMFARLDDNAVRLGYARVLFLSAERHANVVGHTAGLLLEVDEAQDVDEEKFDRDFRPMAAPTNATTVLYGTPWTETSLLERAKQANLEAERRDGVRRHFSYDWEYAARCSPDYARFVEGERTRLGETHPVFATQFLLKTVPGAGRLLTPAQRAQLAGAHARIPAPVAGEAYVAGLDLAGGDEQGAGGVAYPTRAGRGRDATVLTVGRLVYARPGALVEEPRVEIVEHYAWTGEPHETLLPRLIDLLREVWRVRRVAVDATGIGETAARLLSQALGAACVESVKFTAESKSEIGFDLLAAVNGGRLKAYRGDGSTEHREFWRQCELAQAAHRANRTMNFFVDAADGHDDYVVSAALLVRASRMQRRRTAVGRIRDGGSATRD